MIGEKIKELRKQKGMTQRELGDALGVDRSSIGKYETGTLPSSEMVLKIAEFFGVSVDFLYGRNIKLEAENDDERELLVMYRETEGMSENQRKEITEYIKSTIKMYIKAVGADKGKTTDE